MPESDDSLLEACLNISAKAPEAELHQFLEAIDAHRLTRFAWGMCRDAHTSLTVPQIAHLIKLFTRLESLGMEHMFCGGSTTPVPSLVHGLRTLDEDLAKELAIWAHHTSTNPYVASGVYMHRISWSRAADEYSWSARLAEMEQDIARRRRLDRDRGSTVRSLSSARHREAISEDEAARKALQAGIELARRARVAEAAAREARGGQDKGARAQARAAAHKARMEGHLRDNEERAALLAELAALEPGQRLARIAALSAHPGAFPDAWASASAARELPVATRQALVRRLHRAPKGLWRELLTTLRSELKPTLASTRADPATQGQQGAEASATSRRVALTVIPQNRDKTEK